MSNTNMPSWQYIRSLNHIDEVKATALKAAEAAIAYGDLLEIISWQQLNEIIPTDFTANSPIPRNNQHDHRGYLNETIARLVVNRWQMQKRFDICRKATEAAIRAIMNNDAGIDFDKDQAKFGIKQFLGDR